MSAPSPPPSSRFVKCPGCGTRLKVRAEDAGKRAQCHECGKLFRLGGAPAPTAPLPSATAPRQEPRTPEPTSTTSKPINVLDNAHLHPVHCELCQTLMYATDAEVGTLVKCPDCGHRNLAKRREAKRPAPQALVPDGDEYQLDETHVAPPTPVYKSIEAREAESRAAARARAGIRQPESDPFDGEPAASSSQPARTTRRASTIAPSQPAAKPSEGRRTRPARDPRRPLIPVVQGVFSMLFSAEVLVRWVALSITLTGLLFLLASAINAMGNQALYLLPFYAGGCIVAGFWLISAAPLFVAIITQSTDGVDELHDPPGWMSLDYAETGFIIIATLLSALPAWLATKAATELPDEQRFALAAAIWLIVFPFIVLSALEQGTMFAIFSSRIAASLARCFIPWATFYIVSTLAVVAAGGLAYFLLSRANLLALFPIPWLAVAILLLYMRLIGRLGWWIADAMPPPVEAPEE
jgi:DNA-directed RNA polymerase subunit M/transcription elongation factor TFIIS